MDCKITLIPGDGIGPEIVREAVKVLDAVGKKYEHHFTYEKILMAVVPLMHTVCHLQMRQLL